MAKWWQVAALAALLSLSVSSQLGSAEAPPVDRDLGGDHFGASCPVEVDKPVRGDAFLAGCSIDVDAPIGGDALVAGGKVSLGAPIGHSLYAAAGQLTLNSTVGRNARLTGGRVTLGSRSQVAGNVVVAGGDVRIEGVVKGYVRSAAGRLLINGPIEGDVFATAGTVELGPSARIGGQLRFASQEEIKRDSAAEVRGGVQRIPLEGRLPGPEGAERGASLGGGWLWTLGLLLVAATLVGGLPGFGSRIAQTLQAQGWWSLLLGFAALVSIPIAALILLFTLIGAPMALLATALYLVLLLLGYLSSGIALGTWALTRLTSPDAQNRWQRIAAAALGVLTLSLLGRLPYIGGFVVLGALLVGLGALLLLLRSRATAL